MLDLANMPLEAKLTLNIAPYAAQIEMSCAEYILPAPKGIYIKNRLEPAMVDGKNYYTRVGGETVLVTDINTTVENIYDEECNLVIPKLFLLKKEKYLSGESMLPYRGAKIIEILLNEQLNSFCRYRRYRVDALTKAMVHFDKLVDKQSAAMILEQAGKKQLTVNEICQIDELLREEIVKEEEAQASIVVKFGDVYADIRKEVDLFVDRFEWNMYFVKLTDTVITVERYCDWRVYDWEQRFGEEFRKNLK